MNAELHKLEAMATPIVGYLQDHLAGAKFAVNLLDDLRQQRLDGNVASIAAALQPEIESDRLVLEQFAKQIGDQTASIKEAAAWIAQKAGRFKLSLNEPIGRFEAIEMLCLGVLGKLALWTALQAAAATHPEVATLNLDRLIGRAREQHQRLESLRLTLAPTALQNEDEP
jgi:hypothetical protein